MLGRVSGSRRRALRFFALLVALAAAAACDLNPQPEVPSVDNAGGTSAGGVGGGGGGVGGKQGMGGMGGSAGVSTLPDSGLTPCPCPDGSVCHEGACVADPCEPNTCDAKQACKPDPSFLASSCVDTCAGVTCSAGAACSDGKCVPIGCASPCAADEVCAPADDGGYECFVDACATDAGAACNAGTVCDPVSGGCMPDPCIGVKCPVGQSCDGGECYFDGDAGANAGDAAGD
jgi:hypothetical protein